MANKSPLLPFRGAGLAELKSQLDAGSDTLLMCFWAGPFMTDVRVLRMTDVDDDRVVGFLEPGSQLMRMNQPPYQGRNVFQTARADTWSGELTAIRIGASSVTRAFLDEVKDLSTGQSTFVPNRYYADDGYIMGVEMEARRNRVRAKVHWTDLKADVVKFPDDRIWVKDIVPEDVGLDDTAFRAYHTPIGSYKNKLVPALPVGIAPRIMSRMEQLVLAAQLGEPPFDGWADNLRVPRDRKAKFVPNDVHKTLFEGLSWEQVLEELPPPAPLAAAVTGTVSQRLLHDPRVTVAQLRRVMGDICAPDEVTQDELRAALGRPKEWPLNGQARPAVPPQMPPHLDKLIAGGSSSPS